MSELDGHAAALLLSDPQARIGDILTGLDRLGNERIDLTRLDRRSVTTLRRMGCSSWGDLAARTVADVLATPSAGRLTVTRILVAAEERNARANAAGPGRLGIGYAETGHAPPGLSQLHRLVTEFASWARRERGAKQLSDLLVLSDDLGQIPGELVARFRDLASIELESFAVEDDCQLSSALVHDFLEAVGERRDILVRRRIRLGDRQTLQEIGDSLRLSRERVRQLEVGVVGAATTTARQDRFAPLRWRAADLREVLGGAVPADSDELNNALDWATRDLDDAEGCTAAELLLWMAGPYEADALGWLVLTPHSMKNILAAFNRHLGDIWLLRGEVARDALSSCGLTPSTLKEFLLADGRWREIDADTWVRWDGPLAAKAENVLRLTCTPLSVESLNAAIGEGHATTSLRNALTVDQRFVRTDKAGTFGLTEWGLEEYSGIAQEILERIERLGGSVAIEELVAEFVSQFGVSETSVRMYAASPAFVTEGAHVRLRGNHEPYQPDTRLDRVQGLYLRRDGAVAVQIVVDKDVLRGSGRQFYEAAAAALGVQPGGRRDFAVADNSRVVVSWPATSVMGPSLGSVRSLALALGLQLGDRFTLFLDPNRGTCSARPVDPSSLTGLTGIDIESGHEVEAIAEAVRVSPSDVRAALQARGDHEVIGMLPVPASTEDLGDVISEFGELLE